jgi:polyhydroxybutyrate depolymerase
MNFHGGGGTATGQMYLADMRPIADTANFILVYPQGLHLDNGGSTHWNSMLLSDSNKSTVDDFSFIDALINELSLTYNIDQKRLYATGFSNGADIAFALGCYLNNSIAAVAPVSGLMLHNPSSANCTPSNRVGVMIIHGTSDDARPLNGINGYYASIDGAIEFWSDVNSTSLNPNITTYSSDGLTIELHSYLDQEENAYIEYYKIINGEHLWLNITNDGAGTNQLIWNFLSQFSSE